MHAYIYIIWIRRQVKSSQVAFNKKAMTIALHVHNVQTIRKSKNNKKAVLPQGNRAMPQVFFSVEVRQQHSLQV